MLENRRTIPQAAVDQFVNSRATKYIPVKVHVIGNSNGEGYVSIDNVLKMICDMNEDYASQDIRFYFKDVTTSIRFANNQNVYNDGASFAAQSYMISNKSPNCMNIYVSQSVNNQVASYYTGFGDFIFMLNQMTADGGTGSHEAGHFFSLPHTFYGWEGVDHTQYANNNVPSSVSGSTTERTARSGSCSNCASAADGFCDTPADYYSDRIACSHNLGIKDACSVPIAPESSLLMSYFADNCVDSFSPEQKNAVAADILSRGWNTLTSPNPSNVVSGSGVTATSPANGANVPLSDVTITWSPVTGATAYVLVVQRTLFGTPVEDVVKTIVYGSNSYTIPQAMLAQPRTYSWKVKPFNQLNTCSAYSSTFSFNTTSLPSGLETNFSESAELRILSNPVNSPMAEVLINVPQEMVSGIKIYAMDGKQVANIENVQLFAGDNVQLLDVSTLNAGMYMVVVSTEKGSLQQKLMINK